MLYKKLYDSDFPEQEEHLLNPDLEVDEYNIIINALGLRDLVSPGLCDVRKAYVKFSVKSLLPAEQAKAVADIFTLPDEAGVDPNIRNTLKFVVKIPGDP